MDNRIFNVNGSGSEFLLETLKLVFLQSGRQVMSWEHHASHGMILSYAKDGAKNALPGPMSAEAILAFVETYLKSDEANRLELTGWDTDPDLDGDCVRGWRVYVEDWGHVGPCRTAICGIRPAYMWMGK